MNATQALLKQRWANLALRERILLGLAAVFIAAALIWQLGIAPALNSLKQSRAAAPTVQAQLQNMRAQAAQAASLKAQRALSAEESQKALENSVKQSFGERATLSINGERASLSLKGVSAEALAQWLAQVRANARLVPSELRLQKSAVASSNNAAANAPALWDGSIFLNLGAR